MKHATRNRRVKTAGVVLVFCTFLFAIVGLYEKNIGVESSSTSTTSYSSSPSSSMTQQSGFKRQPLGAVSVKYKVVIAVLPGDVHGEPSNDRAERLNVIRKTWGDPAFAETYGVTVLFVPCLWCPDRDAKHPKEDFMQIPFYNVKEGQFGVYRDVLQYIVSNSDADFIMLVHDHTYVLLENLVHFVSFLDSKNFIMTGSVLKMNLEVPTSWFVSVPAGMVLSRRTSQFLLRNFEEHMCSPQTSWHRDNPCHVFTECFLASHPHIGFLDSRDEDRCERFNIYSPYRAVHKDFDPWYIKYKNMTDSYKKSSCVSPRVITFHYVDYEEALYWHQLLHYWRVGGGEKLYVGHVGLVNRFPQYVGGYSVRPQSPYDEVFDFMLNAVKLS
eukprot:PhF_6_TR3465/c0_g1_i2/m.5075/K00731/C1GALT1; glycoprotein-N-acetylgalactosamine 3-beta-galactosyltransferase